MLAIEFLEAGVREAGGHQTWRILDGQRHCGAVRDPAEEAHILGFGHAGNGGRLQDNPVGAGRHCCFYEFDLTRNATLAHCHRVRHAPSDILADPVDELTALGHVELTDLGGEPHDGYAVCTTCDTALDLAARGSAIKTPVFVKEAVEDWINPVEVRMCHRLVPQ